MSGTTDIENVIHVSLVHLQVMKICLNRLQGTTEYVLAKVFEACMSEGGIEVDALKEGVDLNSSVGSGGECTLSTLTHGVEMTKCTKDFFWPETFLLILYGWQQWWSY